MKDPGSHHSFLLQAPAVQYATESNFSIMSRTSIAKSDWWALVLSAALDSLDIPNTLHSPVDVMRASRTSVRMFGTLSIVRANIERYDTVAMSDSSYDSAREVVRMGRRERGWWVERRGGDVWNGVRMDITWGLKRVERCMAVEKIKEDDSRDITVVKHCNVKN